MTESPKRKNKELNLKKQEEIKFSKKKDKNIKDINLHMTNNLNKKEHLNHKNHKANLIDLMRVKFSIHHGKQNAKPKTRCSFKNSKERRFFFEVTCKIS